MLGMMLLVTGGFAMLVRQSFRKAERRAAEARAETEVGANGPSFQDGTEREDCDDGPSPPDP